MADYLQKNAHNFKTLCKAVNKYSNDTNHDWIFRGQYCEWPLETHLERAMENSGLNLKEDTRKVESEMMRQFRRYGLGWI